MGPQSLAISAGRIDITPSSSAGLVMGGYGCDEVPRSARGRRSPLLARCIIFWEGAHPHGIVVVDILGFSRRLHQAVRREVLALSNVWSDGDFVLIATHTHNGPALPETLDPFIAYATRDTAPLESYERLLSKRIVELVHSVLAKPPVDCVLDLHVATLDFARNREGRPDRETAMPVLVARTPGGGALAVLYGFGCHPVAAGEQEYWDGDYPAVAGQAIEDTIPGAIALYLPGPGGDQDPAGRRGWHRAESLGLQVATALREVIDLPGRRVVGPLSTRRTEVSVELELPSPDSLLDAYRSRLSSSFGPPWYRRHAESAQSRIPAREYPSTVPLPLQWWRFGDDGLLVTFLAGEPVSAYGARIRSWFDSAQRVIVVGYANEVPAYLPVDDMLPSSRTRGSYAGGWDIDHPAIAGGSMTVYGWFGHFGAGPAGAQSVVLRELHDQLTRSR